MKNNKITLSLTRKEALETAAALLRLDGKELLDTNKLLINTLLQALPTSFQVRYLPGGNGADDRPRRIVCPVTKKVMRERGDEDTSASMLASAACWGEWDDTERDCALMRHPALEMAWADFLDETPNHEDHEDLVRKFVIVNHKMFAGRRLLLVVMEDDTHCSSATTYALLDRDPDSMASHLEALHLGPEKVFYNLLNQEIPALYCRLQCFLLNTGAGGEQGIRGRLEDYSGIALKLHHAQVTKLVKRLINP